MIGLVRLSLRHRAVTLLVAGLLAVAGAAALRGLDRELAPALEAPHLVVTISQPGAAPEAVDRDLTTPVEAAVRGTQNVRHIESISVDGLGFVTAEYEVGTSMRDREREVRQRLTRVVLPAGVAPPTVHRISPTSSPAYSLSVSGIDIAAVERWVDLVLRPAFAAVPGVASVDKVGGNGRTVTVLINPQQLRDVRYTAAEVANALRGANLSVSAGGIVVEGAQLPVQVVSKAFGLEALRAVPLGPPRVAAPADAGAAPGDQPPAPLPPTVADVAKLSTSDTGTGTTLSRIDGQPSVTLEVHTEQTANTVRTVRGVQAAVDDHPPPPGVRITEMLNQAQPVSRALGGVGRSAALGALLAAGLTFAFLRRLRPTLVAGLSIPLALLVAFVFMRMGNVSLNVLTIGALVVAVGRLIDHAVVVLDNIHRLLETGVERTEAVRLGTTEMVPAMTAATVTTAVVFLPLAFAGGVAGPAFLDFARTVALALAAGLVVAVTVVPALAGVLLRLPLARPAGGRGQALYRARLVWALDHPRAVLAGVGVLLLVGGLAVSGLDGKFIPSGHTRALTMTLSAPPGTSLSGTAQRLTTVEEALAQLPGVVHFTTMVGTPDSPAAAFGAAGSGGNTARVVVEPAPDADVDQLAQDLDALIRTADLSGAVFRVRSDGADANLTVNLAGGNFTAVTKAADRLELELKRVPGLRHVTSNVATERLHLTVDVDRGRAVAKGLDAGAVAAAVQDVLSPAPVTTAVVDGIERQVVVTVDPAAGEYGADLRKLPVAEGVLLGDVGDVASARTPTALSRHDGLRSAQIRGVVTTAHPERVHAEVMAAVRRLSLPAGITTTFGGLAEMEEAASRSTSRAVVLALLLVFVALMVAFRALLSPAVIMATLPVGAVGAVAALALTGRPFGLPAVIGLLLVAGLLITNAIVLLEMAERLQRAGLPTSDALLVAGQARLRPVVLTAAVTTAAVLPLALGGSDGAFLSTGLATAVVGGLATSTPVTLLILPVAYSLAADLRFWVTGRRLVPARPPVAVEADRTRTEPATTARAVISNSTGMGASGTTGGGSSGAALTRGLK